jgi:hypothetical protein
MHCVITLVERDFLYGATVLYNSLCRIGFGGRFVIGYRDVDRLPRQLLERISRFAQDGSRIELVGLDTDQHFTNYKAKFMQHVLAACPEANKVTYVDPDIVASGLPWGWMDTWCDHGPTVCADVNWWMPSDHPRRYEWKRYILTSGFEFKRDLNLYLNGGLLSLHRRDAGFLQRWQMFTELAVSLQSAIPTTGDIGSWRKGGRENPFFTPDQDALNMAVMSWDGDVATFGPDAMGFAPGKCILPHALGADKPWRKSYLLNALQGRPPRFVDKAFWANALTPVPISSAAFITRQQMTISIASALGRVYRCVG